MNHAPARPADLLPRPARGTETRWSLRIGAQVGFHEDAIRRRHGTISALTPAGIRIWVPDTRCRPTAPGAKRGYLTTITSHEAKTGWIWPEPVIDIAHTCTDGQVHGHDLTAHLVWNRESGSASGHTAAAHLAAARRILHYAPNRYATDLTALDLEELIAEFCHHARELRATTRSQYASSIRHATADYLRQHQGLGPDTGRVRLRLPDGRELAVRTPVQPYARIQLPELATIRL